MTFQSEKIMSGRENLPNIKSKASGVISESKSTSASRSSVARSKSPILRKKSSKKSSAKKKNSKKKSPVNHSEKDEPCHKVWKENSDAHLIYTDVSQKSSEEVINNNVTLDPDVFRWDNQCENSDDESKRIEIYKTNRRLRYINARNTQLALLAIKEKK